MTTPRTFVALLRRIDVGTSRRLPMGEHRSLLEGLGLASIGLIVLLAVGCGRVALVEAPRGPDPSSLPPPFHLPVWSHHAEASESEGSTHLQYSVTGVPQKILDRLVARVPPPWEPVESPEARVWRTALDPTLLGLRRQQVAEAAFRHPDGRMFIVTVGHDEGTEPDRRTGVSVHQVELTAAAVARVLEEAGGNLGRPVPLLAVAPDAIEVPAAAHQVEPRRDPRQ